MAYTNSQITRFKLLVKEKWNELSSQEKKIGTKLLENEELIINSSIVEISKLCEVSQPTIVRFCKRLGFNGIKELKIAFSTSSLNLPENASPITWDDSDDTVFKKFFSQSLQSLEEAFSNTETQSMILCSRLLAEAKSIDVIGVGGSSIIAEFFTHEFMRFGKRVSSFLNPYSIGQMIKSVFPPDVIVAISCSGETEEILNAVKYAKAKNCKIIAITSNLKSTLALNSYYSLVTPEKDVFYNDKHSYSRIAQMALITALYIMTAKQIAMSNSDFREHYIEQTRYTNDRI